MNRYVVIFSSAVLLVASTASTAAAQWINKLDDVSDAREFCRHSLHDDAADGDAGSAYEEERRRLAHAPMVVHVGHRQAPVVEYDRVTGVLELAAYGPVEIFDGYSLVLETPRALPFELAPTRAMELKARYETGHAKLRLSFLSSAYARWDQALCTRVVDGSKEPNHRLHVTLLSAALVDEVGQELAVFRTDLGHEVAMMRAHRVRGYLDTMVPTVTVSSVLHFTESPSRGEPLPAARARTAHAEIQKTLYGCYLRGLVRNARLQGALVFQIHLDEPRKATVMIDSIHHDDVSTCAREKLGTLARERASLLPGSGRLKVAVMFKLDDAGSL